MATTKQSRIEMQDSRFDGDNVDDTANASASASAADVATNASTPSSGHSIEFHSSYECSKADKSQREDATDGRLKRLNSLNSYAASKNVAEGLMDIALLSANANQLRFLLTYNHEASTFYISLGLVGLSLVLQVAVGIALIFKRRLKCCNDQRYIRTNEFLIVGVFMITVVNILLAAFTTTDGQK